jgi:hypothetical protein
MGQAFWENGCTAPPLFEALPLHSLEVLNLPFLMELGDFNFFQFFFFLKLKDTWTFISTVGILVS